MNGFKCQEEDVGIDTLFHGKRQRLQEDEDEDGCKVEDVGGLVE